MNAIEGITILSCCSSGLLFNISYLSFRRTRQWKKDRYSQHVKDVVAAFIETGSNGVEVVGLPPRIAQAALDKRAARVKEKEQESVFAASCECPVCGCFDLHWIEDVWKNHNCIRRCRECDHGWYQKLL